MNPEDLHEHDHRFLYQNVFWGSVAIGSAGLLVVLMFLPLALSFAEHICFNTTHIEDRCRSIGLHDDLGRMYEPLVSWLRLLFR